MRQTMQTRFLAVLMALVMVISMIPMSVFAAESGAVWSKVELADIKAEDTIMVTMTNPNGVTYALYTVQSGSAGNAAKIVTVSADGNSITTDNSTDYGWTVTAVEGGYTFGVGGEYLFTLDSNNGVRIGDTAAVWAVAEGYLSTAVGSNTRYLGVYDNNAGNYEAVTSPNWRAYKNTTNNTKNQTLGFWKLTGSAVVPPATDPVVTDPVVTDPVVTDPVATDPTTPSDPVEPTTYDVVINQVYGGGGNSGAEYKNDFVELYNKSDKDVDMTGWSIQYASATGTFSSSNTFALSGTIKAGSFFLVQFAAGTGGTLDLPTPDATGSLKLGASNFKVALVNGTAAITSSKDTNVIDFVGAGTANDYETAAAPAGSSTLAVVRRAIGVDTNDNSADFANSTPYPRNSSDTSGSNPDGNLPKAGDVVVIYNLSAKGVLAQQDSNVESPSITGAAATIADGKATAANGALIFTVEVNGSYFRFVNETYGYLASNGTGNNAFYQETATEDADWTLAVQGAGFTMESRTAKYNGKYSQYLEYFAEAYKTYSMYNVTNYDIYTFQFYPCANTSITAGVVNQPTVSFGLTQPNKGVDWDATFTIDAIFGVKELTVKLGETELTAELKDGVYTATVPADLITGEALTLTVSGKDTKDVAFTAENTVNVTDKPVIDQLVPVTNTETGADKRPVISAEIINAGENPVVTMTINGEEVAATYENGKITYTPDTDLADGTIAVVVTVTRADGETASRSWRFTVGQATYQLVFGQLHSHTTYSDGSGSLDSALEYVKALPESANVDFVAFTDHSNYFDKSGEANPEAALYDMSQATAYSQETWSAYKNAIAAFNSSQTDVIAIGGFEMTWSGGPGHINTFNTPGIVSRNNTTLNNKTNDAGMKAYYALLSQNEGIESISQFNHPGSTFGTFTDFAYWDAVIDSRMYLVEVGNGEGQVGAGGYYPSYEYYTMALDKGWHVAPTNNQDNHKGLWGNANDARDVILTSDFSEAGLYDAIRAMRVYSTEDKNLEIYYTVNGLQLGSCIVEVPEKLDFKVTVSDPDATDSISKVELIVNSGKIAYTWDDPAVLAAGELTVTLDPTYSYYYVRVTEGDGDLAVTAPVWVGESLKLGISSVACGTSTPVTDEELTLTTTLFNSESAPATIKSLTYTVNGSEVIGTDMTGYTLPASSNLPIEFKYTPTVAKISKFTVTAVVELEGEEYTFSMDITLDIMDSTKLVYVGIDASHYNEYVAGNYKDSMGNFSGLASGYGVRTVELKTSADLIAACSNEKYKAIILTAPSRRLPAAQTELLVYTADEVAALTAFNAAGGTLVLAGWSDYYENYPSVESIAGMLPEQHMAGTQNALLKALGSSLRITDDATADDNLNGGQAQRLYFNAYNYDSFLVDGVEMDPENPNDRLYTEVYSQYGGASIHVVDSEGNPTSTVPSTVKPVVYAHATTYSKDSDSDGIGGDSVPKYAYADGDNRLLVFATEQLEGKGLIIVAGAAFMSNFEVQATIEDSAAEKNYSNYKICENLIRYINPVTITDIADVQAQTQVGVKYTVEGVVTSNASGYDKDTAFFDCIYVQDATGGVCCFPVAGNYKIGDKVRVTGSTEFFQGEMELQVTDIEIIGKGNVEPKKVTAAQINDLSVIGQLITIEGTVDSFEYANDLIQTIMVKDEKGDVARVFIDGYITTAEDVQNLAVGSKITVTGVSSYDNTFNAPDGPFPRIRIRNRADIVVEAVTGSINLTGVTLSLEDEVLYNLYFTTADMTVSAENMGLLVWDSEPTDATINGGATVIPGATVNGTTYMVQTNGIPGKNLGDTLYLVAYAQLDNGAYVYSKVLPYSAKTYCMSRLEKSSDANLKALCVALLNYGAAAQEYFAATSNYTYTTLMNADLTAEQKGLVKAYSSDMMNAKGTVTAAKAGTFGTASNGFSGRGASMSADGIFSINYYFTTANATSNVTMYYWNEADFNAVSELTAENATGSKKMVATGTPNQFWANINGIAAKDLDKTIYACGVYTVDGTTYSTGVFAYSLGYYCSNKAENGGAEIKPMAAATAVYSYYAKLYFNK